jgi:8-oxo-dGTP diphosphatase
MITCQFEDGHPVRLRHATTSALIIEGDQILLARRAETLSEGGKWCIPGGYLDRDETVVAGMTREIREETGYASTLLGLFEVVDNPLRPHDQEKQNLCFIFVAKLGEKVGETDWETTELKWFPLDALPAPEIMAFDHLPTIQRYIQAMKTREESQLLCWPFAPPAVQ